MNAEEQIVARVASFSPEKIEALWADFLSRQDWGPKARTQAQKDAWVRLMAIQEMTAEGAWARAPKNTTPPAIALDPNLMRVRSSSRSPWEYRSIAELVSWMEAAAGLLREKIQAGLTLRTHYGVPDRVSGANVENIHLTAGPVGPRLELHGYGWGMFSGQWASDETSDVIRWMHAGCPTGWKARFAGLTAMGFIAQEAGFKFHTLTCGKEFVPAVMILLA